MQLHKEFWCAHDYGLSDLYEFLTPKLNASGNRTQMQGISKRGDPYLRKQLVHGARALLMICDKRPDDALCRWASRLKKRRGQNIAVVAIANRLARLAWVLLNKQ